MAYLGRLQQIHILILLPRTETATLLFPSKKLPYSTKVYISKSCLEFCMP